MVNGIMLQSFEWHMSSKGTLWRRIGESAPVLRKLGVTAVWLPPAYKGMSGVSDVGYGVYDLYDLGEFDQKGTVRTKYGTKEEYIECVRCLQQNDIQAIADIVLGQRLGADEEETAELQPVWKDNRAMTAGEPFMARTMTRFTFAGRAGKWSDSTWDKNDMNAVDWYRDCESGDKIYMIDGKCFAKDVDAENGNFDFLMGCDMNSDDPNVRWKLKRWGAWFLTQTGVDGFRLDAVKHISADFYKDWLKDLRDFTGKELFTVGEYWHGDVNVLMNYLQEQDFKMSLFDVPLHHHFHEASKAGEHYDLRRLFDDTLMFNRPTQAVTFVDNHDTQPGQSLQSWVEPWFKPIAYAMILLRSVGYPCVFYGDLYGIRRSKIGPMERLKEMMRWRVDYAYGKENTYFDDPRCIGFTREGVKERRGSGIAVLCSNTGSGEKRMYVGSGHTGEKWNCIYGKSADVTIGKDGYGDFSLNGETLGIWTRGKGLIDRLLGLFARGA